MMSKYASCSLVALGLAAGAIHLSAQGSTSRVRDSAPMACADLTKLTLENSTTITAATLVTSGTLAVSPTTTLTNLPTFCRVQGVSKPSADSNIVFEVWLPQPGRKPAAIVRRRFAKSELGEDSSTERRL